MSATKFISFQGPAPGQAIESNILDDAFPVSDVTPSSPSSSAVAFHAVAFGDPSPTPTPQPKFTTVTVNNGGVTFVLNFTDADNPTTAFEQGIASAAALLSSMIHNQITVNLTIGYGEVNGQALTNGSAAAGPSTGYYETYSSLYSALIAHETRGDTIFNSLPNTATINGTTNVAVWNAQLKALGYISPTQSGDDGDAGFATDIDPSLLVGVALHELTHAMGRVPFDDSINQGDEMELFRFTSAGNRLFYGGFNTASYFSTDGGNTVLANYGVSSDPSDFLNDSLTVNDPFDEYYSSSTLQTLTSLDLTQLDALGYDVSTKKYVRYDFNADAASDILLQKGSQLNVFASNGSGGFTKTNYSTLASGLTIVGVGDFNGDLGADLMVENSDGQVSLMESTSPSTFMTVATGQMLGFGAQAFVGDYTGNGLAGVFVVSSLGALSLWTGDGAGGFTSRSEGVAPAGSTVVGVGDFNGDHKADVFWRSSAGALSVWESHGDGTFSSVSLGTLPSGFSVAGVYDFDDNGEADLLLRNASTGKMALWFSNGTGFSSKAGIGGPPTSLAFAGVGDYNGDGFGDILFRNSSNGQMTLWEGHGTNAFTQVTVGAAPTTWNVVNV